MAVMMSELPLGGRARVLSVRCEDALGMRLMEMGLVPGTEVVYEGAAPLGDPLVFVVRGYRLSLRKEEASRVEVEPG